MSMEDQHASIHALCPALLLIPDPLQPPIHRNYLRDGEPLRLQNPFRPGPFLTRIQLRDPDAQGAVGPPEPFQCGIRQQMRRHSPVEPSSGASPP